MKMKAIDHVVESEVLVIGSGLAGSLAAIGCDKLGKKVVIVNKARLCWGGSTIVCGGNTMAVCFPEDDKESWIKELVDDSDYLADQEWLKIFVDESYNCALELDRLGKEYNEVVYPADPRDKKGGLWRIKRYVNNSPLLLCSLYAAQNAFRKHIAAKKIGSFDRIEMAHLLSDGHRVVGAVGFNYRTGETYLFRAKAVVLACGACGFRQDAFDSCGEGPSMAYEIGAEMACFDKGGSRVRPRYIMHSGNLFPSTVNSAGHALGGKLVNRLGEAFFDKASLEVKMSGRLGIDSAVQREVAEGRGPIFEDFTQIAPEIRDVLRKMRKAYWKLAKTRYGVDLFDVRVPIEKVEQTIVPNAGERGGGVWVDYHCASSIPGLYAVGDNTWPVMSFEHPRTGSGLGWALLSGSRVGKFVAGYVASVPLSTLSDKEIAAMAEEDVDHLALPLTRSSGVSPDEVTSRLLRCMIPYDEIHSDGESMEKALTEIARLQNEDIPNIKARDYHELKKAVEVKSIVLVSEMILRSELFREESRCGVRRKDFPMTDNIHWLKWILLQKREDKMQVYAKDVPTPYVQPARTMFLPGRARA